MRDQSIPSPLPCPAPGDGMTTRMEGNVFARTPTDPSVPTESHLPPTFPAKTFQKYFHIRDAVDSDFKSDVRSGSSVSSLGCVDHFRPGSNSGRSRPASPWVVRCDISWWESLQYSATLTCRTCRQVLDLVHLQQSVSEHHALSEADRGAFDFIGWGARLRAE